MSHPVTCQAWQGPRKSETEEVTGPLLNDMPILFLHLSPGKSIYPRLFHRKKKKKPHDFHERLYLCICPSASAELIKSNFDENQISHLSVRLLSLT